MNVDLNSKVDEALYRIKLELLEMEVSLGAAGAIG